MQNANEFFAVLLLTVTDKINPRTAGFRFSGEIWCFFRYFYILYTCISPQNPCIEQAHWMASGSADQALSRDAISFYIAGKTWKVGDEIHSIGIGAIEKKKMVQTFGDAYATARAEGVFMGRGSGHKFV